MNIKEAKEQIKNAMAAYLLRTSFPTSRSRSNGNARYS